MADVPLPVKQLKTVPSFVLGSLASSTYPKGTPAVLTSPAASLANRFELPGMSKDDTNYMARWTAVAFALPG